VDQTESTPPARRPAIVARGLDKRFGTRREEFVALQGVDLEVGERQFCTLIGPSGCGKSTLLRILADVIQPSSGQVEVLGVQAEQARRNRDFGFVFQDPVLLPWRSAEDNVALPLEVNGVKKGERRQRARELLHMVGLEGFEKSLPAKLSGGMARRVAIARALILEPRVLFLDEPFNGLDEIRRQHMNEELQRIWLATGTTAVLVTHNVAEAVFLSDKVVVMGKGPGRILAELDVDLPRPRTVDTMLEPQFIAIERELTRLLRSAYEGDRRVNSRARGAVAATYLVLFAVWEAYGRATYEPGKLFPPPTTILRVLWEQRSSYLDNVTVTVLEAAVGFGVGLAFAVVLALFIDRFRRVGNSVYRLALALYSIPLIALAPALTTWFGLGFTSKAAVAALAAFFPIVVNLAQALRSTDSRVLELADVLSLPRLQSLRLMRLPYALPALVASFKIAGPAAFIAAMIAEWIGAERGLGLMLLYAMFSFQLPELWAALILATAVIGLTFALFELLGRVLVPWHSSVSAGREA
jgi:ABC-type nitrate/sulfonate/bicarbonate transport system ATPase subunit/ABC-type nitrate/sulfonate/bicarbonate transport system permease component